jgi:hypothetical protein
MSKWLFKTNSLVFPGRLPGFNPNHLASGGIIKGTGLSWISKGANGQNLLNGAKGTVVGTAANIVGKIFSPLGMTTGFVAANTNSLSYSGNTTTNNTSATFAAMFYTPTLTTGPYITNSSGSSGIGAGVSSAGALINSNFGQGGSGGAATIVVNTPYFAIWSISPSNINYLTLNLNNGKVTTQSVANSVVPTAPNGTYQIGSNSGDADFSTVNIAAAMFSPNYLSIAQMRQWAQDPWAFWYPHTQLETLDWIDSPNLGLPHNQYDWPLPKAPLQPERTIAQNFLLPYPTPPLVPLPFDYPLNPGPPRPDGTFIAGPIPPTVAQAPFNQYDWALPRANALPVQSWTAQFPLALIGKDALPHNQYDWPLPRSQPTPGPTITQSFPLALIGQDKLPALNRDWPLPQRPAMPGFTWTWQYNANLIGKDVLPRNQYDWPLPTAQRRPDATWSFFFQPPTSTTQPFNQYDWPLPRTAAALPFTWTWQYNANLIGQDALPHNQYNWPLPNAPTRPDATYIFTPPTPGFLLAPFRQQDWPLTRSAPLLPFGQASGFPLALLGQDALPFRQQDWPNPRLAFRPDGTWLFTPIPPTGVVQAPFNQYDWPLPRTSAVLPYTWSWSSVGLIGLDVLPFRQQDWPNPRAFARPDAPYIFTPPTPGFLLAPFRQQDWPLPRAVPLLPFGQASSFPLTLIGQDLLPFNQFDWPLGRVAFRPDGTFILSPNPPSAQLYPFNQYDWPLPRTYALPPASWTVQFPLVLSGQDALPFRQQDWPLTRIPAPIAFGLAASFPLVLIGLDALPFRQQDWPNPQVAPRPFFSLTWNTILLLPPTPPVVGQVVHVPHFFTTMGRFIGSPSNPSS